MEIRQTISDYRLAR